MSGLLILISSPSGGGKTSIIQAILNRLPEKFVYSISGTTRKPRAGEANGKDYVFLSEQQFQDEIRNNRFLEWEKVHGYYYGTDSEFIKKCVKQGKFVLLDIDVNGALQVDRNYKGKAVTIFIAPPSIDELIQRLKNRKTDSEKEINKRLERIPMEMEKSRLFDYILVNEKLEKTVSDVIKIVNGIKSNLINNE